MGKLLGGLVLLATVVACTPAETPSPSPQPTATESTFVPVPTPSETAPSATETVSAAPSPSPSPTEFQSFPPAPATESAEQAEVRAAWMEYWRIYEKFMSDPSLTDLTETQTITTGEQQNLIIDEVASVREDGIRTEGGFMVRDVEIQAGLQVQERPVATVAYCVDRTQLKLRDISSDEPVPITGPVVFQETATLERGEDNRWRVSRIRTQEAGC